MSPHYKTNIIFVYKTIFSLLAVFAGGLVFGDNLVFAYSTSISTSGTVEIEVSASGNNAGLGTDSVVVDSPCPLGYTLSISGGADNNLYKDGDDNSDSKIITSAGTSENPLPVVGDGYLNTWGYTTTNDATINSGFIGLTGSMTPIFTKDTGSASGGDTIPVYYGVSVGDLLESGIYKMVEGNAITYYLTADPNCSSYVVEYDGNNADAGTTMSVQHTNVQEDDEIDLYASNYKRAGYGFAGWSTTQIDPDASNAASLVSAAASNGEIYGPMATITADADFLNHAVVSNNKLIVTLYAVWIKPVNDATLQGWTGCGAMSQGEVIALKDQRDNDVYAVAKLADDNCWMIENLRLDYDAEHNADGLLAQGYGTSATYGNFIGLAEPETNNFIATNGANDATTANSLYYAGTQSGTASVNISQTSYAGYRMPRYNNNNTNATATTANPNTTTDNMTGTDQNIYSYGNYYTWAAAMANTSYYDATTVDANGYTPSEAAGTSICPKGWKLPYGRGTGKGATSGGFSYLDIQLGDTGIELTPSTTPTDTEMSKAWRSFPNNFLYSGGTYYMQGTTLMHGRGSSGHYWSSTVFGRSSSYYLSLNSISVNSGSNGYDKYNGISVRCLVDANSGAMSTMSSQSAPVDTTMSLPTGVDNVEPDNLDVAQGLNSDMDSGDIEEQPKDSDVDDGGVDDDTSMTMP
ncbi:hypothetical protein IKF26_02130 [Candidatus Saccharibacteria bacterium]|nr:hypothetical protein [Candidatus Saccharibacteria bacterium]